MSVTVYKAIGITYNIFGRLKKREVLEVFATKEDARNFLSREASKYDEIEIEIEEVNL